MSEGKSKAMAITLTALITAIVVGGGVYFWQNNDREEGIKVSQETVKTPETKKADDSIKNSDSVTYQSTDLGISFEYPSKFGTPFENRDAAGKLISINFSNDKNKSENIQIGTSTNEKTLRTCEDILKNGFNDGDLKPANCETLNINNQKAIMLTYVNGGMSNSSTTASKSIQFQTKQGLAYISTMNQNLYEDLENIAKSIK